MMSMRRIQAKYMETTIVCKWLTVLTSWYDFAFRVTSKPGLGGFGPTAGGQPCKQESDPGDTMLLSESLVKRGSV